MVPRVTPAGSGASPADVGEQAVRGLAWVACAALLVWPVRSFVSQPDLPLWFRSAWPLVAAAAWRWPLASAGVFLAAAPLLPIVPPLAGWPPVAPGEVWLHALLVPAGVRVGLGRRDWRAPLPLASPLLLVLATASLVVVLAPAFVVADGRGDALAEFHRFLGTDLAVATFQTHAFASVGAWMTLADGLAALWLVASEGAGDRARAGWLAGAAGVGTVAVAAFGCVQWWTRWNLIPFWLQQDPGVVRINATFPDVNALGAFLVLGAWIPLALAWRCANPWARGAWRAGAAAVWVAIVFSGSRSAWVAWLAGGVVYLALAWRAGVLRPPAWFAAHARVAVAGALAAVVLTGAALTAYATLADVRHGDQHSYVSRLLYTLNLRTSWDYRLRNRTAMWEAAARMMATHPVFGIGIGRYYKDAWAYTARRESMIRPRENAHNYYLQVGAELGWSGLAAVAGLLAWGMVGARRGVSIGQAVDRRLAAACGAGIVAFAVTLIGGHALLLREVQVAFWPIVAIAGLLGAGDPRERGEPAGGEGRARARRRVVAWLAAVAAVVIAASVPFRVSEAVAQIDLSRVSSGLHGDEVDTGGTTFSWTSERAVLHVPASAKAVSFALRSVAPLRQTVTLRFDGRVADTLVLDDHQWRPLRYLVPSRRGTGPYRRVEILVAPVWRPPGDPRPLGVMLRDFRWEP